jgi:predicted metal-dependent hydrolase
MSHKSSVVAERVARFGGGRLDSRYLGYFDSFNHQRFHEAHDVLEDLWLLDRRGPNGDFFKGLIQLAGAFVLLQKGRLRAADAVFQLAEFKLCKYPRHHESVDLTAVVALVTSWRQTLKQTAYAVNPLTSTAPPFIASPSERTQTGMSA